MSGTFMLNNRNYTASGNLRLGGDVANPNIADVYDPTQTYNTGDRRIYNDVLYVCNDDNVTGAWDSTKWDSATVDEIISALTAADIPYSSGVSVADMLDNVPTFDTLTTSDNNKLLGVSVSGSDISVGAVYAHNYSTSEIAVGTWIDGKTIYQKTITQNITQGTYADFDFNVNSDDIIDVNVICHKSNNIWFKAPIRNEVGSNYYQLYCFVNTANSETHVGVLGESSTANYFDCECTVTLRYTKA